MLFPKEGITSAHHFISRQLSPRHFLHSAFPFPHKPLPPFIELFSLNLLNQKLHLSLQYIRLLFRQLQPTRSCLLSLPVTSPLAAAPSLPLHTCFPELSAKSLQSMHSTTPMSSPVPLLTNRNIFETPGVRNVADRYAAQGGTTTHLPGVATPRGMFTMLF
jgi:hypothetical protein